MLPQQAYVLGTTDEEVALLESLGIFSPVAWPLHEVRQQYTTFIHLLGASDFDQCRPEHDLSRSELLCRKATSAFLRLTEMANRRQMAEQMALVPISPDPWSTVATVNQPSPMASVIAVSPWLAFDPWATEHPPRVVESRRREGISWLNTNTALMGGSGADPLGVWDERGRGSGLAIRYESDLLRGTGNSLAIGRRCDCHTIKCFYAVRGSGLSLGNLLTVRGKQTYTVDGRRECVYRCVMPGCSSEAITAVDCIPATVIPSNHQSFQCAQRLGLVGDGWNLIPWYDVQDGWRCGVCAISLGWTPATVRALVSWRAEHLQKQL